VVAGNFAIAFAHSYWQLLFWKVFTGIGTGACFVAGARYITEMFSGPRLHLAQGLYGGSILLGSGFVILAIPRLLETLEWRGVFLTTAAVAVAVWLVWILIGPRIIDKTHAAGTFRDMLLHRELWLLGLAQMATFGLAIVAGSWVIAALRTGLGLPPARAGLIGSAVLLLGIVVRPLGGALVPRTGVGRLLRASLLINTAGCFLLALEKQSTASAAAAIALLGVGCGLPYAALFTRAAVLFPGRAAAAMGLVNTLGIVMILMGAPLVGKLADWSGSFRSSFLALGVFSLATAAVSLRISDR
jgi:MFS transporter, NNP family, nitrate/nitrite transporter